jgi:sugar phosphate isomerase/epimerase
MLLSSTPPLHLTYCLNVHPGETWDACARALREKTLALRTRVAPGQAFGLGLRLGAQAARQLARRHHFTALQGFLREHDLYVFTINGFPYGRFHDGPVKTSVYQPDWQTEERAAYTELLADLLAALLPPGARGSISTVPLSFRACISSPAQVDAMVRNLTRVAARLDRIEAETGRDLHIGLEPEPACCLETTAETVRFFRERLLAGPAAGSLRRRIGVCFDTCHVALQFEDLAEAWDLYRAEGIRISKVQLSAALTCPAAHVSALKAFDEPVYLHQTHVRDRAGRITRWTDLPEARPALAQLRDGEEVRVHFHVPLHWGGSAQLGSTRDALTDAFRRRLRDGATEHLEIETYTFDVLPAELRSGDVVDSMAGEFAWVRQFLGS